ncbi:caffeoylshikimate esterase [Mercurialis annua]|uniref:caffeoylshikimate esterase n=1 Tax=Mercurialis annua TaxID=3986 RepID=UPI00215E582C|nr:caffeoylshikimate esterase [Mercurialis annua]
MDFSHKLRLKSPPTTLTHRKRHSPITHPLNHQLPIASPSTLSSKFKSFSVSSSLNSQLSSFIMSKFSKKRDIEGVSEELNLIASQNLDHAPARRLVRSAFVEAQRQLDHPLFKWAPTGITTQEWYERNSRGLEIFLKSWMPPSEVVIKGAVFISHGYGDTCTFFMDGIARRIAASGYAVYALDHPGFGLSQGLHGYIPDFEYLVDNVMEQYTTIKGRPELKGLPCFLLGQSMGGAVTLKVHLKDSHAWDGMILIAPMCRIAEDVKPPPLVLKAVTCLSRVLPKAKLVPQKDLSELFIRDLKTRKMAEYNVISYNSLMRLKTAVELSKATEDIEARLEKVSAPLLIIHGAADKVTDPQVSQFLYERASSKDKTLKLYEEGYHCILEGEPGDIIFGIFDDIVSWLDFRCSTD